MFSPSCNQKYYFAFNLLVVCARFRRVRARSTRHLTFEIAFLIGAGDYCSLFSQALNQVIVAAGRALFRDRFGCGREFAFGILRAAVKRVALAGALFNQFAFAAQRTLYADEVLLHILAVGIAAAGCELAVAAVTND